MCGVIGQLQLESVGFVLLAQLPHCLSPVFILCFAAATAAKMNFTDHDIFEFLTK